MHIVHGTEPKMYNSSAKHQIGLWAGLTVTTHGVKVNHAI